MHAQEGSLLKMQPQDPSAEVGEVTWLHLQMPFNSCARQAHQTGTTGLWRACTELVAASAVLRHKSLHQEQHLNPPGLIPEEQQTFLQCLPAKANIQDN